MSELLSEHEKSVNHMRAFQLWTELHQRLRLGKTIDVENQNSNLTLKPLSQTRWESKLLMTLKLMFLEKTPLQI
jgi:hypothetical protein